MMNTTDTSQMTHQNPVHDDHHQPPLMESHNKIINQSSSSSLSTTTDEETQEPSKRLPSEASDSDKKQSVSWTEKKQEQELQEQQEGGGDGHGGDDNARERLKRHRREVAGRVWIPEIWGQENLLKDWIDCSSFDSCLVPTGISSARAALIDEARGAASGGSLRLENRCLILR